MVNNVVFSGCHRDECQSGLIWKLINDLRDGVNRVLMKFWDEFRLASSENTKNGYSSKLS